MTWGLGLGTPCEVALKQGWPLGDTVEAKGKDGEQETLSSFDNAIVLIQGKELSPLLPSRPPACLPAMSQRGGPRC